MCGETEVRVRYPFLQFGSYGIPGAGAVAVDGEGEKKLLPSPPSGGDVVVGLRRDAAGFGHERWVGFGGRNCGRVRCGAYSFNLIDLFHNSFYLFFFV